MAEGYLFGTDPYAAAKSVGDWARNPTLPPLPQPQDLVPFGGEAYALGKKLGQGVVNIGSDALQLGGDVAAGLSGSPRPGLVPPQPSPMLADIYGRQNALVGDFDPKPNGPLDGLGSPPAVFGHNTESNWFPPGSMDAPSEFDDAQTSAAPSAPPTIPSADAGTMDARPAPQMPRPRDGRGESELKGMLADPNHPWHQAGARAPQPATGSGVMFSGITGAAPSQGEIEQRMRAASWKDIEEKQAIEAERNKILQGDPYYAENQKYRHDYATATDPVILAGQYANQGRKIEGEYGLQKADVTGRYDRAGHEIDADVDFSVARENRASDLDVARQQGVNFQTKDDAQYVGGEQQIDKITSMKIAEAQQKAAASGRVSPQALQQAIDNLRMLGEQEKLKLRQWGIAGRENPLGLALGAPVVQPRPTGG